MFAFGGFRSASLANRTDWKKWIHVTNLKVIRTNACSVMSGIIGKGNLVYSSPYLT